jgi:type II secretory pathway pseudopilin PulG
MIEMAIAVMIMVLILSLAVPSLNGVLADRRLHRSLDEFNSLVRQAQERSIAERRSYLIIWGDGKIGLRAEGLRSGEGTAPVAMLKVNKGESFNLSFPAALENEPPAEWIFWPSGNCEPAVVTFRGLSGEWTAKYSALTARADLTSYVTK